MQLRDMAVAGIVAIGIASVVVAQVVTSGDPAYNVRALDLDGQGERRAIVVMDDGPYMFQYGGYSHGTTEFCLAEGETAKTSPTCFRTKDFNSKTTENQKLRFARTTF